MRTKVLALIAILPMLFGCLRENYSEKEKVLSVPDITSITLDAEELGDDDVYADVVNQLITIKANRSWSAIIRYRGDEADWLSLSEEELLNLHEYSVDEPVTVIAKRNKGTSARKAEIVVSSDKEHIITIPVEQKGQNRFIEAVPERTEALSIQDTVEVKINCNTQWSVALDAAQTTALAKLDVESGEDNGILKVCFDENFNSDKEKQAVIALNATGCPGKELVIKQRKGVPYIEFRMKVEEIPAEIDTCLINFGASVDWNLTVKESSGVSNVSLSESSGGPTSRGDVVLRFDRNGADPGGSHKIVLQLSSASFSPIEYTLTQKGCIHLDFLDYHIWEENPTWSYQFKWAWESPAKADFPATVNDGRYLNQEMELTAPGGFVFKAMGKTWTGDATPQGGIWYNAQKQGFLIGRAKGSYLEMPALPNLTLKAIVYEPSHRLNTTVMVTDADGTVLPGGESWKSTGGDAMIVTREMMENHFFELQDTKPNTPYRIVLNANGAAITLKDLVLIYE